MGQRYLICQSPMSYIHSIGVPHTWPVSAILYNSALHSTIGDKYRVYTVQGWPVSFRQ